jgi:sugar phosphate isomerase/epimerase
MISRRQFIGRASAAAAYAAFQTEVSFANPLNLPAGIQLYSVRQQLAQDYDGTLLEVSKAGYTEVEAAGFYNKSAAEVKQAMQKAKLRCVSSHHPYGDLRKRFDEILAYNKDLGVQYIICSSPGPKDPTPGPDGKQKAMTLDDWKWLSEEFNKFGAKTKAAGITFGYHNHVHEFEHLDGGVPYTELLKLTDPTKVTLELDCGWATVAGVKPVDLMREHPNRFSMLHVKDFKLGSGGPESAKVTELGMGDIDYRPIFAEAAKTQKLRHIFVEQEAFDVPWKESLKIDADYIKKLKA